MSTNILTIMENNNLQSSNIIQNDNKIIYKTDNILLEINKSMITTNNIIKIIDLLNSIEKNNIDETIKYDKSNVLQSNIEAENIQQYNLEQIKKHEETKYIFV